MINCNFKPTLQNSETNTHKTKFSITVCTKFFNNIGSSVFNHSLFTGSDLLTSLTTTFDRKWKSLMNPLNQMVQRTTETSSTDKEDVSNWYATDRVENTSTSEVYRDPSLHKSSIDKNCTFHSKNVRTILVRRFVF